MKESVAENAAILVRASAGLGQHVLVVFATRLIPAPSQNGPHAVFERSHGIEWQGVAVVDGAVVAECEAADLSDAIERLKVSTETGNSEIKAHA